MIQGAGVAVPLHLITRPFDVAIANAGRSIDKLAGRLAGALNLGAVFGAIGGGLTLGAVAKEAASLESQLAKLQRIAGISGSALKRLGDEIKQVAMDTPGVKLDDILGMAQFGAKMGIASDKLGMFTRDAARFSQVLEGITPEDAATGFARLSTVFGTGIEQTRQYAAALVALDQASTATGAEILSITQRMAPMAKLLGMTPQRAMALATTAREAGIRPEVAGTSLQSILGKMADPKSRGAFANIAGKGSKAFGDTLHADPGEALSQVSKGLAKMDADHAIAALDKLHLDGQRVRQTMLALGQAAAKEAQFVGVANEQWDKMTVLERGAEINANTLNAQLVRLYNNFQITAAALGAGLLPILKKLADSLVNVMQDIQASIEKNKGTFAGWGETVADVVGLAGLAWREFPTFVELGKVEIAEKLEQVGTIMGRFGNKLLARFNWLNGAIATVLGNIGRGIKTYMVALFENLAMELVKLVPGLAVKVNNALVASMPAVVARSLGLKMQNAPKGNAAGNVLPDAGKHFGNIGAGIGAAPGFGGMMDNLPNMNILKAPLVGRLRGARAEMDKANADRKGAADAKDAEVRSRAESIAKEQEAQRASLDPVRSAARRAANAKRIKDERHAAFLETSERDRMARKGSQRLDSLLGPMDMPGMPGGPSVQKMGGAADTPTADAIGATLGPKLDEMIKLLGKAVDSSEGMRRGGIPAAMG